MNSETFASLLTQPLICESCGLDHGVGCAGHFASGAPCRRQPEPTRLICKECEKKARQDRIGAAIESYTDKRVALALRSDPNYFAPGRDFGKET